MIRPEIDLELSIKALEVYGIEPNIMKSMLSNLQKVVKQNCNLQSVSVSLRDFFAAEAMKAECISWNAELSDKHRAAILEDMIERWGQTTVYEAIALNSWEMADNMLKAKSRYER